MPCGVHNDNVDEDKWELKLELNNGVKGEVKMGVNLDFYYTPLTNN